MKIEDLCPYEENKAELVNEKTLKRFDFKAGIQQIENEILRKEARAIELALEDNDSSNMNENTKSLKRKIDDDNSVHFNGSIKLACPNPGAAYDPETLSNDRPYLMPNS